MKALFNLPPSRSSRGEDSAIAKKAKSSKKSPVTKRGGGGIVTRIAEIKAKVLGELGKYEGETLIIRDELELSTYISKAIAYGEIAVDTETNGLDPLLDLCVGVCLYVPNEKAVYVPINHVSHITMERVDNQLTESVVAKYLKLLDDNSTKIIMFNAVFDIRVLKNQVGVRLHCYWDCKLASRLINENERFEIEGKAGLKALHKKYVLNGIGDAFSFDELFKGVKSGLVPISVFALYSAHDPKITWELYDFQRQILYYDPTETPEGRDCMNGVSWAFFNVEMPVVDIVVDIEDTGVAFDTEYAKKLSVKYTEKKQKALQDFYDMLKEYQPQIDSYKGGKLDNPVNVASPAQLAILFYDILGYKPVKGEPERGTGEPVLTQWNTPLTQAILKYRGIEKLLSTYIDKLPNCLNPNDHRVHGRFNSYGADTGRFSSKDPNLQNIPSHNKDIRPMFVATDEEKYVDEIDNSFTVDRWSEVNTSSGWVCADSIVVGDILLVEDSGKTEEVIISKIETLIDKNQIVYYY